MATFDPSSREREAHEEIAATRVGNRTASALVVAALALALLALALEAVALMRGESRLTDRWSLAAAPDGRSWLDWNRRAVVRLREIDRRVDQRSALADALRPWGQLALAALFGYGNEEAYLGHSDWLVYRPDFDHLTGRGYLGRSDQPSPVDVIADFAAALARRGIALLLLPIPAKPTIHPESLAGRPMDDAPVNVDDGVLGEQLRAHGVSLLDPRGILRRHALDSPAYLKTDTHWRPGAMDAVARETAILLRAIVELPVGSEGSFREEAADVEGPGDTAALLVLPQGARLYPAEQVEARRVGGADGAPWRPTRGAPVLLLGDSFSAIYSQPELGFGAGAGFAERLSFHLGLPVDRLLRNAGGATATREALAEELARDPERLGGARVVVWQFAARELSQGSWRSVPIPHQQ